MPTLLESIKKLLWSSDSGGASVPVADSGARSANHSVEESASSAVVLLLGSASEKNRHGFSLPDLHKGGVKCHRRTELKHLVHQAQGFELCVGKELRPQPDLNLMLYCLRAHPRS